MLIAIRNTLAVLLLAFLVLGLPAAANFHNPTTAKVVLEILTFAALAGAAGTVTYRSPAAVKGFSTAPTAAHVTMADASTVTTVVHSLAGVSTNGLDGSPMVHVFAVTAGTLVGAGVSVGFLTSAITLTNTTTAAGNGSTWRVIIWRHSLITNYTT